jgi:hypothetical protein
MKIFVLYVGIIAAIQIQEHAYDHCHGIVSGAVYIYPNPLGHTLKSFPSIEYEFGVLTEERGRLRKWFGEVSKWFHYITDDSKGSETLPVI